MIQYRETRKCIGSYKLLILPDFWFFATHYCIVVDPGEVRNNKRVDASTQGM